MALAISGDSSDAAATRVTGLPSAELPRASAPLAAGTTIDRYVLVDVLGSGGMGVVYRAFDPDLARPVAIKLVRPAVAADLSSGGSDRLLREAQALARLSHPNVVAVYDVGTFEDQVFLAMELIDGEDLKTWLRLDEAAGEPRTWKEILIVFLAAGRGLAAAHAQGLVHRDFKPRNVLIGKDGRVRVVDFGLARLGAEREKAGPVNESARVSLSSDLTGARGVVGTPAYMAPEQWDGEGVDAKSDQFSFCVALYQALYRQLPFAGEDDEYRSNLIAGRVRETDTKNVPGWLHETILRGLDADASRRHPSMQSVLDAFERRLRPRRWAYFGGLGLFVGAAIGAAAWAKASGPGACDVSAQLDGIWDADTQAEMREAFGASGLPYADHTWAHVDRALDDWSEQWVEVRRESCEATLIRGDQARELYELRTQCLDDRLAELAALVELLRPAHPEVVEKAVEAVDSLSRLDACSDPQRLRAGLRPPSDPELRLEVQAVRAELKRVEQLARTGQEERARTLGEALLARVQTLDYLPIRGEVELSLAGVSAQPADARARALEALDVAQRSDYTELEARAWIALVRIVGYETAQGELGLQYAAHADAVLARMGTRPELLADLTFARATVLDVKGDLEEALLGYQRAYDLELELSGPDHLGLTGPLNGLGIVHHMSGRDDEAIADFEQALELRKKIVGPIHPAVASLETNIGAVYSRRGDCESAIVRYQRALEILEAVRGPEHPDLASPLNNLGVCLQAQGRLEDARIHFERSLQLEEKLSGPEHPNAAGVHINLGRLARARGDHQAGLEHSQRAYEIFAKTLGPEHLDTAFAAFGVGVGRFALGDAAGAVDPLELALRVRVDKDLVKENVAEAQFALAQALWDSRGDRARALLLVREARDGYAALGQAEQAAKLDVWLAERAR